MMRCGKPVFNYPVDNLGGQVIIQPAENFITETGNTMTATTAPRHDWTLDEVQALFDLPLNDLLFKAHSIHRENFDPNAVQVSTLLSIKTGACPEDCKYCSQSAHYESKLEAEKRIAVEKVISEAKAAKDSGSSRFCMGAAWRNPRDRDMPYIIEMIKGVKGLGLEKLVVAIACIQDGAIYLDPQIAQCVVKYLQPAAQVKAANPLTDRELEVLKLMKCQTKSLLENMSFGMQNR